MDAALQGGGASNYYGAGQHQEADETTPSDVSERPSVDDVESETGSTGALETRSLKDHKGTRLPEPWLGLLQTNSTPSLWRDTLAVPSTSLWKCTAFYRIKKIR